MIADSKVVSIHYHLTSDSGEVLDSSRGREPLLYLHGHNNIIPGLENALTGKVAGDKLDVSVAPEEGYGLVQEGLFQDVPRSSFPEDIEITVGQEFTAQGAQGPLRVVVSKVEGDTVTVDANHPLAGQTLNFAVEILEVRDATEQELSHGHVHAGGHDH